MILHFKCDPFVPKGILSQTYSWTWWLNGTTVFHYQAQKSKQTNKKNQKSTKSPHLPGLTLYIEAVLNSKESRHFLPWSEYGNGSAPSKFIYFCIFRLRYFAKLAAVCASHRLEPPRNVCIWERWEISLEVSHLDETVTCSSEAWDVAGGTQRVDVCSHMMGWSWSPGEKAHHKTGNRGIE